MTEYITKLFENQPNIADRTFFQEWEIGNFIRDHNCVCGSHLISKPAPGRQYFAWCPKCDKAITETSFIHKVQAEAADQNIRLGMRELQPEPIEKRSEKQILSELGF